MGDSAAWQAVQRPEPATLSGSREVLDENQLFELGKNNLLWLGFLEEKEAAGVVRYACRFPISGACC